MKNLLIKYKKNRVSFKILKWDTAFFGINSYTLDIRDSVIDGRNEKFKRLVVTRIPKSFITAKIASDCPQQIIDFLFDLNFRYIDIEVTLQYGGKRIPERSSSRKKIDRSVFVEKAKIVPGDAYLLGKGFTLSRFHSDKNITTAKADLVWINYIKNFILSDEKHLFIAKVGDRTVGGIFIEQHKSSDKKVSTLQLICVDKKYRGKNIGSRIFQNAVAWCAASSDEIVVGTQVRNIGALNFYIKNGFTKISETKLILHRWNS